MRSLGALTLLLAGLALGTEAASAAGPPGLGDAWASQVFSSSARLNAEIDPNGNLTTYHFDYITEAVYQANEGAGKDGFAGALRSPAASDAKAGSGEGFITVLQLLFSLQPDTTYRYRLVASNADGTATGPNHYFSTQPLAGNSPLLDERGWEMVSPVDKNGGRVDPPGALAGGGTYQAAVLGGSITYSSAASFAGGQGAPPTSQYIATRDSSGWSTLNVTVPLFSGSYDEEEGGAPYRIFSGDLDRGLLLSGKGCRGDAAGCPMANPPLQGTDAPAGYQNYYLRDASGGFEALLGASDVAGLGIDPAGFELRFAGASPDLSHVVLSTCAALSADATDGCGAGEANLYEWSAASGFESVNILPGDTQGTPGAALAAQAAAVSVDGGRVYWTDTATGNLYLREEGQTTQVDAGAGGGGTFETAAAAGSTAFFTRSGHLWRYLADTDSATDLTPSGGVVGVLGSSSDASHVYYLTGSGLYLCAAANTATDCEATAVKVADGADPGTYPPATGTARVSADGSHLLFVATAPLTGFDNTDLGTGDPDSQVYLYDAIGAGALKCVSCNPTNGRPSGASTIPGAVANGTAPGSPRSYKPRVLSADGRRVFFESDDALSLADTNKDTDVYEWEKQGAGSCTRSGGCLALVSSGRATGGATFVDASADGADAFFLTDGSLVDADPGSADLYDARAGGGFPEPADPIPCNGDACQALPPAPVDPTLTTLLSGPGNPDVRYRKYGARAKKCRRGTKRQRAKCIRSSKSKRAAPTRGSRR